MSYMIGGRLGLSRHGSYGRRLSQTTLQEAIKEAASLFESVKTEITEVKKEWSEKEASCAPSGKVDRKDALSRDQSSLNVKPVAQSTQWKITTSTHTVVTPSESKGNTCQSKTEQEKQDLEKKKREFQEKAEKLLVFLAGNLKDDLDPTLQKDFQGLVGRIESLVREKEALTHRDQWEKYIENASLIEKEMQILMVRAESRAVFVTMVEKVMESLAGMGFGVSVSQETEEAVTLRGESGERSVLIELDEQKGIRMDFSHGYEGFPEGQCIHDIVRFLTILRKNGLMMKVVEEAPITQNRDWYYERKRKERELRQGSR